MLGFREFMAASQQGGSAPTSTTWDPLAIGNGMTLSNGNLTVEASSSVTYTTARATTSKSTGKWYFEGHLDATYLNAAIGLSNSTPSLDSYLGADGKAAILACLLKNDSLRMQINAITDPNPTNPSAQTIAAIAAIVW